MVTTEDIVFLKHMLGVGREGLNLFQFNIENETGFYICPSNQRMDYLDLGHFFDYYCIIECVGQVYFVA